MREHALMKLEYGRAIEAVRHYLVTYPGKRLAERLEPSTDLRLIRSRMAETEEARRLLSKGAQPPLPSLEGVEEIMMLLGTGYILSEPQLGALAQFIRSCGQLKKFMEAKSQEAAVVASYSASMYEIRELLRAIEGSIDRGRIVDGASAELGKVRKRIRVAEEKLHRKLDAIMAKHAAHLQERLVSQRSGRFVLPVKKEYRKLIRGAVLDESSSGQTVFVEPEEASLLQQELGLLRSEESREELRILAGLTEAAEGCKQELSINIETIGHYDLLFAKAKWALAIGGRPVELNEEGVIELKGARHPFLGADAVPLDVTVGGDYRSLLITGPNTGGKTLALKTVGLLTLLAQTGLLVPAAEGSRLAVFRRVEADIGDDQSLDRSLSTFSAHLTNLIGILAEAGRSTLVLLDELATGTDPGEGVGLSIAVLEELHRSGSVVLATTHFNEIKQFARVTPGFRNARMAFDEESLRPLYRLDMGEAGDSYAFVIARRLGVEENVLRRAKQIAERLQAGRGKPEDGELFDGLGIAPAEAAEGKREGGSGKRKSERGRDAGATPEFKIGDVVWIPSLKAPGTVYRLPDERGNLTVQVKGQKLRINRKRIKPYIDGARLYPEQYDLDIVFESVASRKLRKRMSKRHVEGASIETPSDD
ncbi:endonuclease MutS2 [Cohnella fermenti]|uniref:DNA mismatch repair protein MutS n=1 Tax=Cohnella fermenti TaxID=2565925 RepID=A0A4V3WE60_9BACL|nr:DNA mismatch repair protein MutS [Cohnella fermenti]THF74994.1 DNA mismatch repair protein MutS [Cohnella fermenti]